MGHRPSGSVIARLSSRPHVVTDVRLQSQRHVRKKRPASEQKKRRIGPLHVLHVSAIFSPPVRDGHIGLDSEPPTVVLFFPAKWASAVGQLGLDHGEGVLRYGQLVIADVAKDGHLGWNIDVKF